MPPPDSQWPASTRFLLPLHTALEHVQIRHLVAQAAQSMLLGPQVAHARVLADLVHVVAVLRLDRSLFRLQIADQLVDILCSGRVAHSRAALRPPLDGLRLPPVVD